MTENALVLTAFGTGLVSLIGILLRRAIIQFFSDRSELRRITASDRISSGHLDEIIRLEALVKKLSGRVADLEERIDECVELEIQDAADIAELTVLIEGNCSASCPHESTSRMREALKRIRERRSMITRRKKICQTASTGD